MITELTRRRFLYGTGLAACASLTACTRDAQLCADPDTLSRGEEQMRQSLEYLELSTVAGQDCAGCQFFSEADARGCGHCELLNGPVSSAGYCTSWAS